MTDYRGGVGVDSLFGLDDVDDRFLFLNGEFGPGDTVDGGGGVGYDQMLIVGGVYVASDFDGVEEIESLILHNVDYAELSDLMVGAAGGVSFEVAISGLRGTILDARQATGLTPLIITLGLGDDIVFGSHNADEFRLAGGDDRVFAEGGDDIFLADFASLSAGAAILDGGDGLDTFHAIGAAAHIDLSVAGAQAVFVGRPALFEFTSIETLRGAGEDDVLIGDGGANQLIGDGGEDRLAGGGGDDILEGGVDDDILLGGAGLDTLEGGAGDDTLTGGEGDDIIDGGDGVDTLDLS